MAGFVPIPPNPYTRYLTCSQEDSEDISDFNLGVSSLRYDESDTNEDINNKIKMIQEISEVTANIFKNQHTWKDLNRKSPNHFGTQALLQRMTARENAGFPPYTHENNSSPPRPSIKQCSVIHKKLKEMYIKLKKIQKDRKKWKKEKYRPKLSSIREGGGKRRKSRRKRKKKRGGSWESARNKERKKYCKKYYKGKYGINKKGCKKDPKCKYVDMCSGGEWCYTKKRTYKKRKKKRKRSRRKT
jgi:hypothetical protein